MLVVANLCILVGCFLQSGCYAYRRIGAAVKSVRLDRYFRTRKVTRMFDRTVSMYLIPKKNIAGVGAWADILMQMMASSVDFLSGFFHRNVCESGFSSDIPRLGRVIRQKEQIGRKLRSSQTLSSKTST